MLELRQRFNICGREFDGDLPFVVLVVSLLKTPPDLVSRWEVSETNTALLQNRCR